MTSFIYSEEELDLENFSRFVSENNFLMRPTDQTSTGGLIPNITIEILENFIDYAYPSKTDIKFREINKNLLNYYLFRWSCFSGQNSSCILQGSGKQKFLYPIQPLSS